MWTKYRGVLIAFGCLTLAGVVLAVAGAPPQASPPLSGRPPAFDDSIPAAGELRNLALAYDARIAALEEQTRSSKQAVSALQQALGELAGVLERSQVREEELQKRLSEPPPQAPTARLLVLNLPPDTGPGKGLTLPAGSFGEATLLTGVFAPVTGEPMPVLVRLDAVLTGPRHTRVPVQGAFLIGKAAGDANSSRAVIQLTKLSVGDEEKPMNGWVVDDDGVQGVAGEYVWNAGRLAALSSLSGFAQGAAKALGHSETTTVVGPFGAASREVTGDPARFVGAGGAAAALESLSKLIEQRMQEFTPAVYVHNRGRRVTVVFLETLQLRSASEEPARIEPNLGGFDR